MGISLSLVMTELTIIALVGGIVFGLIRGRNRSILRLIMIIGCIVAAYLLRGAVMNAIMGVETPEGNLKEVLLATFNQGEVSLPQSIQNIIFALLEMIIGIVSYFVLFFMLRALSEIILFPILKIFIKKGAKKGVGVGAIVGLVQGVIIAFAVLTPLNGLLLTFNEISKIEIDGHHLVEVPSELGIDTYSASAVGKVYGTIGDWYFDSMTNVKMEDGKEMNLEDACSMVTTVTGIASSVTGITESVEVLSKEDAQPEEKIDAVQEVGDKLIELGDKIDNLSDNTKEVINGIIEDVKEMIVTESEGNSEGVDELFENLDLESLNLKAVGQGLKGIATYIEKTEMATEETEDVKQEDVNNIIQGLAGSQPILDLITSGGEENTPTFIEVPDEHEELFETAINGLEGTITPEQQQVLRDLFGIN